MSKKITDYKTLTASYPDELDVKVQEMIDQGWQPYGHQFFQTAFHQPMVRYHEQGTLNSDQDDKETVRIEDLNLGVRGMQALLKNNVAVYQLEDPIRWLNDFPARELLKMRGCGRETLKEIVAVLREHNVEMDLSGFDDEFKKELEVL